MAAVPAARIEKGMLADSLVIELKAKGNAMPTKNDAEQESKPAVKESDPNNPDDKDDQ